MYLTAKSEWRILTFLAILLGTVYYQGVFASHLPVKVTRSADESLRDCDTYIIKFKSEKDLHPFATDLTLKSEKESNFSAEIIEEMLIMKCLTARLSRSALDWVKYQKTVLSIKENEFILVASSFNSTPNVSAYWHLDRLDQKMLPLDKKYTVNLTGENVDVYILDTGIHYEHEDFDGRAQYPGCDPIDKLLHQNQAGRDCDGHGTHVAGLVGGNGTGVATGVTLFSVRIINCTGVASMASLIHGLMCVINHRKDRNGTRAVINLSIAGSRTTGEINSALQLVLDQDIIITTSAGNGFRSLNYDSCKVYPASYPGVISVGATDMNDNALMGVFGKRTLVTNMGKCLDIFAPGYKVLSSYVCPLAPCDENDDNNTECNAGMIYDNACRSFKSGTSQSAPLVAGAVALLLEKCPKLTNDEVKYALNHSLSINKVVYHKALEYAMTVSDSILAVVLSTMSKTSQLLHIGNELESINCSALHNL